MKKEKNNSEKIGKGNPPKQYQFKKGIAPNPNGRPKKIPALEELFLKVMTEQKDGLEAVEAVILQLRNKAIRGDMKAIEYLLNRMYGKPKESVDITSKGQSITQNEKLTPEERRAEIANNNG
jgi:hypothetical protein